MADGRRLYRPVKTKPNTNHHPSLSSPQMDFSVNGRASSRVDRPRPDGWDSIGYNRSTNSTNNIQSPWDSESSMPRHPTGHHRRHTGDAVDMTLSRPPLPQQRYPLQSSGGESASAVLTAQVTSFHRSSPATVASCVPLPAVDSEKVKQHHYKETRSEVKELMEAVKNQRQDHVKRLLDMGVDVNASTEDMGSTALHLASQVGDVSIIQLLLLHGADRHKRDIYGRAAEYYANAKNLSVENIFHNVLALTGNNMTAVNSITLMPSSQFLRGMNPVMYQQQQLAAQVMHKQLVGQMLVPPGMPAMYDRKHSSGSFNIHATQSTGNPRSEGYFVQPHNSYPASTAFNQAAYDHFPRPYEHMQRPNPKSVSYTHRTDPVTSKHVTNVDPAAVHGDEQNSRYPTPPQLHPKVDKIGQKPSSVFESYDKTAPHVNHSSHANKKPSRHASDSRKASAMDAKPSFMVEDIAKPAVASRFTSRSPRAGNDSASKHAAGTRLTSGQVSIDPSRIVSPLPTDFYRPQSTHTSSAVGGPPDPSLSSIKPVQMSTTLPVFYQNVDNPYTQIPYPTNMQYGFNSHEVPGKKAAEHFTMLQRPEYEPKSPLPHLAAEQHRLTPQYGHPRSSHKDHSNRTSALKVSERNEKTYCAHENALYLTERKSNSNTPVLLPNHHGPERADANCLNESQHTHKQALHEASSKPAGRDLPLFKQAPENAFVKNINNRRVHSHDGLDTDVRPSKETETTKLQKTLESDAKSTVPTISEPESTMEKETSNSPKRCSVITAADAENLALDPGKQAEPVQVVANLNCNTDEQQHDKIPKQPDHGNDGTMKADSSAKVMAKGGKGRKRKRPSDPNLAENKRQRPNNCDLSTSTRRHSQETSISQSEQGQKNSESGAEYLYGWGAYDDFSSSDPENDNSSDEDFCCPIAKPSGGRRGREASLVKKRPVRQSSRRSAFLNENSPQSFDDNFSDYELSKNKSPSKQKGKPAVGTKASSAKKRGLVKTRSKKPRKVSSESASSENVRAVPGKGLSKTVAHSQRSVAPPGKLHKKIKKRKWKKAYNYPVKSKKRADKRTAGHSNGTKKLSKAVADHKLKKVKDKISENAKGSHLKKDAVKQGEGSVRKYMKKNKSIRKSLSADDAYRNDRKMSFSPDGLSSPPFKRSGDSPTLMDLYKGEKVASVLNNATSAENVNHAGNAVRAETDLFGDELTEKEAEVLSHSLKAGSSQGDLLIKGNHVERDTEQTARDVTADRPCASAQADPPSVKKKRGRKPKSLTASDNGVHLLGNSLAKKKKMSENVANLAAGILPKHIKKLKGKDIGKGLDGKPKNRKKGRPPGSSNKAKIKPLHSAPRSKAQPEVAETVNIKKEANPMEENMKENQTRLTISPASCADCDDEVMRTSKAFEIGTNSPSSESFAPLNDFRSFQRPSLSRASTPLSAIRDYRMSQRSSPLPSNIKKLTCNSAIGETVLHKAARHGYLDNIQHYLERGMDVNTKDNAGYTALHEACVQGRLGTAQLLLEFGADVNINSTDGTRPVHDAVEYDHLHLTRLLLSCGADPLLSKFSGRAIMNMIRSEEMGTFVKAYLKELKKQLDEDATKDQDLLWNLPASSIFDEKVANGYDALAFAPEEDSTCMDMEFELFDELPLDTYFVQPSETTNREDYYLLSDVMKKTGCSRGDFLLQYPVDIKTMAGDSLLSEMTTNWVPNKSKRVESAIASSPIVELVTAEKLFGPALSIRLQEDGKICLKAAADYNKRTKQVSADVTYEQYTNSSQKPCCSRSLVSKYDGLPSSSSSADIRGSVLNGLPDDSDISDQLSLHQFHPNTFAGNGHVEATPSRLDLNTAAVTPPRPAHNGPDKDLDMLRALNSNSPSPFENRAEFTSTCNAAELNHITSKQPDCADSPVYPKTCGNVASGYHSGITSTSPAKGTICNDVSSERNGDKQSPEFNDSIASTSIKTSNSGFKRVSDFLPREGTLL